MRFTQNWGSPSYAAAQRAQQATVAYRSRQQPSAEEATAILSPFFYRVENGRHGAVQYDARRISINYIRTDDMFSGDYMATGRDRILHIEICASRAKATTVANKYAQEYVGWDYVGVLAEYNTQGGYNRVFARQTENTLHYVIVTDLYTPSNLARLVSEVYRDMGLSRAICDAVLTRDLSEVHLALESSLNETLEAQAQEERERAEALEREAEAQRARERIERAGNPFLGLDEALTPQSVQYPKNAIDTDRAVIDEKLAEIRTLEIHIRQLEANYLLAMQNNGSSELTAMIEALKADPEVIYFDRGKGLHTHTYMRSWSKDNAESLFNAGARVNNFFSGDEWYRALIKELFLDETTKWSFKGFYKIKQDGSLHCNGQGIYANPHHLFYNCFGEYTSLLQNAYRENDYMQWYGLFKACISTVNVLDGAVMDKVKRAFISHDEYNAKWLLVDGEHITTREWRRRYEANELHVQHGGTDEHHELPEEPATEEPEDDTAGQTPEGNVPDEPVFLTF